jgi:branched-chain amino acid transport system substrate-binding protein
MAVEDLNAAGGVPGQKLKLGVVDDACEGSQAVAAAQELVSEGVVFVVGYLRSAAAIPASGVYEKAGVPDISPAATNPKLTEPGSAKRNL